MIAAVIHNIFLVILAGILLAGVVWFTFLGLGQRRRARVLGRLANRAKMRFSREDQFDIPQIYRELVLFGSGHSRCASNVTFGRFAEKRIYACDFHYEIGHGMRRSTRHYGVILADAQIDLPSVLMWNELDAVAAPLEVLKPDGRVRRWSYVGDGDLAAVLAEACIELADQAVSIQTAGSTLMMCMPIRSSGQNYTDMFAALPEVLGCMASASVQSGDVRPR